MSVVDIKCALAVIFETSYRVEIDQPFIGGESIPLFLSKIFILGTYTHKTTPTLPFTLSAFVPC